MGLFNLGAGLGAGAGRVAPDPAQTTQLEIANISRNPTAQHGAVAGIAAMMTGAANSEIKEKGKTSLNFVYVNHLNVELKRMASTQLHLDVRIKACGELAHILYHGGILEGYLLADPRLFDTLMGIIQSTTEPLSLRMKALQTFSIVCRSSPPIQALICEKGAVELLIKLLNDSYDEMRKWAVHSLLFLMVSNYRKYMQVLKSPPVQMALKKIVADDWSKWTYNDAEQLMRLID
ncbi:hypothetical protein HDU76_000535 [Blyttiomyces sp. JEL0837]|nr:hypothetical protein HDU76_000535 [Blyttiomyces sp. JEL0837]